MIYHNPSMWFERTPEVLDKMRQRRRRRRKKAEPNMRETPDPSSRLLDPGHGRRPSNTCLVFDPDQTQGRRNGLDQLILYTRSSQAPALPWQNKQSRYSGTSRRSALLGERRDMGEGGRLPNIGQALSPLSVSLPPCRVRALSLPCISTAGGTGMDDGAVYESALFVRRCASTKPSEKAVTYHQPQDHTSRSENIHQSSPARPLRRRNSAMMPWAGSPSARGFAPVQREALQLSCRENG